MVDEVIADYAGKATAGGFAEEWDLAQLFPAFRRLYPVGLTIEQLVEAEGGEMSSLTAENITERMQADAQAAYDQREEGLTPEVMRELERRVVLSVLDAKWREHLYEMDYLQSGIHMRGHAQRDPLVEYQREGYELFTAMMDAIKEESVGNLFNLQVEVAESPIVGEAGPDGEWIGARGKPLGGQVHGAAPPPTPGAGVVGPRGPEVAPVPPPFSSTGPTPPNRP